MKKCAPKHVSEYCYVDKSDSFYCYLQKKYGDDCSFVYKIKCTCGSMNFFVYKDAHPSIFAKCCCCEKNITIYDLAYYPAAVKLKKDFQIKEVDKNAVLVYANYEYDDEFLYEEDVLCDENGVTWGKVFIRKGDELIKILDDETAWD